MPRRRGTKLLLLLLLGQGGTDQLEVRPELHLCPVARRQAKGGSGRRRFSPAQPRGGYGRDVKGSGHTGTRRDPRCRGSGGSARRGR